MVWCVVVFVDVMGSGRIYLLITCFGHTCSNLLSRSFFRTQTCKFSFFEPLTPMLACRAELRCLLLPLPLLGESCMHVATQVGEKVGCVDSAHVLLIEHDGMRPYHTACDP